MSHPAAVCAWPDVLIIWCAVGGSLTHACNAHAAATCSSAAQSASRMLPCRAHRPDACGQCQGTAVPIGGTACESQHQVSDDTQGLQGLLRASGAGVTLCHCGLRRSERLQVRGPWWSLIRSILLVHLHRCCNITTASAVVVCSLQHRRFPVPGSHLAAHDGAQITTLDHLPVKHHAFTQYALPDTAYLAG